MPRQVTIVMYHYVRDLKRTKYPEIKGLELESFKNQIEYFNKYYEIVTMERLIDSVINNAELPPNSLLLTFDDAYLDHYINVFPVLDEQGIQGSFFPIVKPLVEHKLLDLNKIHFILASTGEKKKIFDDICYMLRERDLNDLIENNQCYSPEFATANRLDNDEVIFIKRMLQSEIPDLHRQNILQKLFNKYVATDEESFASELYMSVDQLKCLKRHGMYIGSHAVNHDWMTTIDVEGQSREIDESLEFLKKVGCDNKNWVFCYPFGAYNESLLTVLKNKGCACGLTTEVNIANLDNNNPLILPRLDTIDLPMQSGAEPNQWTQKII